ncbi:MAG: metallophosphoesterase [Flavobacteriales bacterium]|nr:metallophosphoesterase [Flavobacteriales bacterium]
MTRLLVSALLLFLIDLYFYQAIRQFVPSTDIRSVRWLPVAYWSATLIGIGAVTIAIMVPTLLPYQRFYLFSVVMVLTLPKLLGAVFLLGEDAVRLVSGIFRSVNGSDGPFLSDRRQFVANASLIAAALPFSAMVYGMVRTAFNFSVRKETLTFPSLPLAFDGLRVVQISDMHSGSFASTDAIHSAIDLILEQRPDIIFFTGDMVNNRAEEAEPFLTEISRLKAPLGVFSVLGNHDYGDYVEWPDEASKRENLQRLIALQREAGWNVLINGSSIIEKDGQQMAIIGVENWGAAMHFPKYGDLSRAVQGTESAPFRILLSHDPSHWEAQVIPEHPHIDLTLSGHTHGFQFGIEIPGFKWSPVQYVYRQWAGLYSKGGQHLYVNRGLGFLGFMGRIGIPPEITLLELKTSRAGNA